MANRWRRSPGGQRHLGVQLLAVAPGRPQPLERRAVVVAPARRAARTRRRGPPASRSAGGRPVLARALGGRRCSRPVACRVQDCSSMSSSASGRDWTLTGRAPGGVGRADADLELDAPPPGAPAAPRGSARRRPAAHLRPAWRRPVHEAPCRAAGPCRRRCGRPARAGSRRETRPVRTSRFAAGEPDGRAEQPVGRWRPARTRRRRRAGVASSQYRLRWKG